MEADTITAVQTFIDATGLVIDADTALQAQIAADTGAPDPGANERAQIIYQLAKQTDRVARRLNARAQTDLTAARSNRAQAEIDTARQRLKDATAAQTAAGKVRLAATIAAGRNRPPEPERQPYEHQ